MTKPHQTTLAPIRRVSGLWRSELACVQEMARCLGELKEWRWLKERCGSPYPPAMSPPPPRPTLPADEW